MKTRLVATIATATIGLTAGAGLVIAPTAYADNVPVPASSKWVSPHQLGLSGKWVKTKGSNSIQTVWNQKAFHSSVAEIKYKFKTHAVAVKVLNLFEKDARRNKGVYTVRKGNVLTSESQQYSIQSNNTRIFINVAVVRGKSLGGVVSFSDSGGKLAKLPKAVSAAKYIATN